MLAATSATVTGLGNSRLEPSGSVMAGIVLSPYSGGRYEGPHVSGCVQTWTLVCIGRRDWTRTNDPHHVKVVL